MAKKHTGQCACSAVKFEFDFRSHLHSRLLLQGLPEVFIRVIAMATFFGVPEDEFTPISGDPKESLSLRRPVRQEGSTGTFAPSCGAPPFHHQSGELPSGGIRHDQRPG